MTEDPDATLGRTERRFLRRIFNGRTEPVVTDGRPILTYKDASRYLLSLSAEAREQAYLNLRHAASITGKSRSPRV